LHIEYLNFDSCKIHRSRVSSLLFIFMGPRLFAIVIIPHIAATIAFAVSPNHPHPFTSREPEAMQSAPR
jgi:hypothetical protein